MMGLECVVIEEFGVKLFVFKKMVVCWVMGLI